MRDGLIKRKIVRFNIQDSPNGFAPEARLLPYVKATATLREGYWRSLWIQARLVVLDSG